MADSRELGANVEALKGVAGVAASHIKCVGILVATET
jgi:hypothetical protein